MRVAIPVSVRIILCCSLSLILFSAAVTAQVHGVPASVTSMRPGDTFRTAPGVPASVTSPGPFGFNTFPHNFPRNGIIFANRPFVPFGRLHRGFGFQRNGFFPFATPFFTPIVGGPVFIDDPGSYDQAPTQNVGGPATPTEPQKIEVTVVNKTEPEARRAETTVAKSESVPEPALSPTVIVLTDGRRKELHNYAIMGKDIFDVGEGKMFRIPLNTVDVDATIKANAAEGKQFQLPNSP